MKKVSLPVGFILGIAFVIRFQLGFTLVGVGLWSLFIQKDLKSFANLCLGFVLANLTGFGSDYIGYGEITIPAITILLKTLLTTKLVNGEQPLGIIILKIFKICSSSSCCSHRCFTFLFIIQEAQKHS